MSQFATLKTLTPDEISSLNSFTAVVNENAKTVDFTFTPYPDSDALNAFDGLYHGVEGYPNYTGTKVFDKKAVYGPIVYKVEVFQNGTSLGVTNFTTDTGSNTFNITPGVEARVCGYYGYQNDNSKSNQVCVTLSSSETSKLGKKQTPETPMNSQRIQQMKIMIKEYRNRMIPVFYLGSIQDIIFLLISKYDIDFLYILLLFFHFFLLYLQNILLPKNVCFHIYISNLHAYQIS